jgi:predicted RND superfamily exporter protein
MKSTFFARRSLLILAVVLFLLPFCVRGARLSARNMKNEVKDWLPAGFKETRQLEWFRDHFLGEQFVIISWKGCREGDARLELLTRKLTPLSPEDATGELPSVRRLGLRPEARYDNWGGREEKWLRADDGRWYFILPNGVLHAWAGEASPLAAVGRFVTRAKEAEGRQIAAFSPRFYNNPWLLADPLFKTVTTGPQLLARLTSEEGGAGLSRSEALRRLQGVLFGPDGEQTCLIVTLSERAKLNLHTVVGRGILGKPRGRLYSLAEECGIAENELRLGGPPVDNVAIDEEGSRTLVRLVGLSVLLGVGLAYACFRSIKATMIVFSIGAIAAVMSLSLVWWCGSHVDAVLMSMPSLVYVLGISGAVHIINHYRAAVEENGYVGASEQAIIHGWKPALLCSVTTAFGLASLCTSEIVPIAKFGFFSALAVLATLALLFTYLPAVLHLWPLPMRGASSGESSWLDRSLAGFWQRLGSWIIRHYALVGVGCVLLTVAVGYGVTRMHTSVQLIKMFDGRAKIIQDYRWLETNLGKLVPMELVVRVEPDMMRSSDSESEDAAALVRLSFLERMELTHRVERVIRRQFGPEGSDVVGPSMSAATFAPPLPEIGGGFAAFARRGGTNRRLEAHREELLNSDYLRVDEKTGAELWRVSLRLGAFNDVDYGQFVDKLQAAVEPVIDAYAQRAAILRQLVAARGDRPLSGARVLLIGESETSETDPTATRRKAAFVKTLYELLTVARLEISAYDAAAVEKLAASGGGDFDCVVLLNGVPDAARAEAAHLAPLVVEADAPTLAANAERPVSVVYTGVVPLVYKAQRTLLEGLVDSTFWSFVTITPLLILVARSFWAGLVAMIPNAVPVLLIFGGMGWLGIDVDIGSMMTASIALGVAVDDTIHFLTWYREALRDAPDRRSAILKAYQCCATPTFQSAVISGLGLSIFAFSTFTPTQRFGYLMLAILMMGMFAELIFFPALLASPLGRVFKPAKAKHLPQAVPEEVPEEVGNAERGMRPVLVETPHSALRVPRLREKHSS